MDEKLEQAAKEIGAAVMFIEAMVDPKCDVKANSDAVFQCIAQADTLLVQAEKSPKVVFAREELQRAAKFMSKQQAWNARDILAPLSLLLEEEN